MAGWPWHRPSPGARAAPAGERSDSPARAHARASQWCEGEWAGARPRSQRTGWGGRAEEGGRRLLPKLREEREAGPALAGSRAREGEAGVPVRCVCSLVWRSRAPARARRGAGTRAQAPTPAAGGRAGARAPSGSPRPLGAVGHPERARVNFSARERAQVRDFLRHARARALLPFPSEVPLGCGWGGCGRGCVSLAHPTSLILLWLLEFEEERSRGRRGWVCRRNSHVSLASSPSTPPARTPARWPPHSRRPHGLKFPPLRFALDLKMAPESLHIRSHMLQSPGLSPPHPSSSSLTVSRQSPQ